ncbi:MAG TPA: Imm52 family immunity protein [Aliidongia sp.]|nr:Imm52 family immunity protein [Aliidongia sp.]
MMLMEATTLYAYWGNRREGFEACATRMAAMLDSLAAIHPAFETWLRQDPVSKQWSAFGGRPRTIDGLAKDLAADWDEEPEINRSLMPNFGFNPSAWNGEQESRAAAFRGSMENIGKSAFFANLINFTLRSRHFGDPGLISAETMARVLAVVAPTWDALWATVYPNDLWQALELPRTPLRTGWLTYLSAPFAADFVAPPGFRTEPCANGGLIIVTTEQVFDPRNQAHLALADQMRTALDRVQPATDD